MLLIVVSLFRTLQILSCLFIDIRLLNLDMQCRSDMLQSPLVTAYLMTNVVKRMIRQVSDMDNVMGLVQTENIQVHAEAYDVALDMSFPKGMPVIHTPHNISITRWVNIY